MSSGGVDGPPVTFVVPLPPSYRGGTEEYAYRLAGSVSRLAPTRILTTTVRWNPGAPLVDVKQARIERIRATEFLERPLVLSPRNRARVWNSIRRSRVLNLHMPFPLLESTAARVARRAGIPSVFTYHMDAQAGARDARHGPGITTRLYRRFSACPALDECDAVVANSRGYAENSPVLSHYLRKVRVIPKGIDPERLGPTPSPNSSVASRPAGATEAYASRRRLVYVGRLVPYKGVSVLLAATAQLVRESRDVQLLIAGQGPLRSTLEESVGPLGLRGRVDFLGFVQDEELGDLYRYADVVVVPSMGTMESSATALEEAAACGVPIVGSDLPGASESIPNDGVRGLLVPPGDVDRLAGAIVKMLEVPRPGVPESIRTWTDVANDYIALFRDLGAPV